MSYALIVKPNTPFERVEEFDSPYSMSYAHRTYNICEIEVTPTIDGEPVYSSVNAAGNRTYYKVKANAQL